MQLKEMTVLDTAKRGVKKIMIEFFSIKFWAAVYLGYANWHIIREDNKFDLFGMSAFLLLLGVREASDLLNRKLENGGGEKK